jgi:hypothetical protein
MSVRISSNQFVEDQGIVRIGLPTWDAHAL